MELRNVDIVEAIVEALYQMITIALSSRVSFICINIRRFV